MYRTVALAFALGVATTLLLTALLLVIPGHWRVLSASEAEYYAELDADYGKYYKMRKIIEKNSYFKADTRGLDMAVSNALLGIVGDKYSEYYTPEEYEKFERKYLKAYSGIGVATEENKGGQVVITRVIEDGPADEAGVRAGDVIVSIDGTEPKSLEDASRLITGDAGSRVDLSVNRDGENVDFSVYREKIEDKSVTHEVYDTEIAYIRIETFRDGTADEFAAVVKELKSKGFGKFIIDLRGNSGGVSQEGIDLADRLLPACKLVTVKNKRGEEKVYNSDAGNLSVKYAILVDGRTASASEIVVGAVKENRGGIIVGSRTYGKGMIQSLYEMDDGSVLKITTDEYLLPGGERINEVGVKPDISVDADEDVLSAAAESLR